MCAAGESGYFRIHFRVLLSISSNGAIDVPAQRRPLLPLGQGIDSHIEDVRCQSPLGVRLFSERKRPDISSSRGNPPK